MSLLLVSMLFTVDDKILLNVFILNGYNAQHLVSEFPTTDWNVGNVYKWFQKLCY